MPWMIANDVKTVARFNSLTDSSFIRFRKTTMVHNLGFGYPENDALELNIGVLREHF